MNKKSYPWRYFGLTFLISWAFTVPAALARTELDASPAWMVVYAQGVLALRLLPFR
jgi:hypothetical protein